MLVCEALRQNQINQECVYKCETRREKKWRAIRNMAQDSTYHRTESKSQAERGSDQSHRSGTLLRSRYVSDVRLRDCDIPTSYSGENSRDKEQRQPTCHSH